LSEIPNLGQTIRKYYRNADWQITYDKIIQEDISITWHSLIARGLAKTATAARKLLSRHAKAGLLRRYAWPGLYLTMSQSMVGGISEKHVRYSEKGSIAVSSTELDYSTPSPQSR